MIVSLLLFLAAFAGLSATLALPQWSALTLPAAALALLTFALLLASLARRRAKRARRACRTGPKPADNWVLLDGSNVMFWQQNLPRIETVREVVRHFERLGHTVAVVFDASAGHRLVERYLDDRAFAQLLDLPESQVFVVPSGTPADPYLLSAAARVGARIVTNDRFRDWTDAHPEQSRPEALIRGGYRRGALWLDLPPPPRPSPLSPSVP